MLEIGNIREHKERILAGLHKKNASNEQIVLVDKIIAEDDNRKNIQTQLDNLLSKTNKLSDEIGILFKSGKAAEASDLKNQVSNLKEESKSLDIKLREIKDNLEEMIIQLPNTPHESVPVGSKPEDNEVFQGWEQPLPELGSDALPHWELAEKYNLISFKDGVTLTGSGFPVYKGKGARLQRALINFFVDEAVAAGYQEVQPPLLVNKDTARATGQLPDKEGQMYYCEKDDFYLIPTAEVPLTNLYRDTILSKNDFPIKMTGYTPCFRREAGSYGAHVRGLNRLHQFDKVEIVRIEHPDKSYKALDGMVEHVKNIMRELKLPFRILRLCGGDMSFASALTYDFEVFSTAQDRWLEISSVSNFETFQANRLKLRFRDKEGKNQLAHTLNGSSLALPRVMAGIIENYQTPEGIVVPEVLRKYTGFDIIN